MSISIIERINAAYAVMKLTKRYFRASQVPEICDYYINGSLRTLSGQHALVMLMGIVLNDCYGLKRFRYIENIVDIGANIGIFAVHAATIFPQVKIYAYEPCREVLPDLERNLQELNVQIYPYAVGGITQKVKLHFQEDFTACSIETEADNFLGKSQECDMIAFDEITTKLGGKIGLLKLDCEGSEYEIIQSDYLTKVKYIVGEFHTCKNGNPERGLKLLQEKGFIVDNWSPFPDGKGGEFWASNSRNTAEEKSWLL